MFKFKVGDEVIVTNGRDKGKKGKIEKVLISQNSLIVAGVNIYKRHKKVSQKQKAGIYETTKPIGTAKIALICPKCGKITRVAFSMDGKVKIRICSKCKGRLTN